MRENHARLCKLKARIISLQESLDPAEAADLVLIANKKHDHETFMEVQDLAELAQRLISNKVLNDLDEYYRRVEESAETALAKISINSRLTEELKAALYDLQHALRRV